MKLWLVVHIFGVVVGSWGPLPYDLDECKRRVAEIRADFDVAQREGKSVPFEGVTLYPDDVKVKCGFADRRPVEGDEIDEAISSLPPEQATQP